MVFLINVDFYSFVKNYLNVLGCSFKLNIKR